MDSSKLPPAKWWDREDLTLRQFKAQLDEFRQLDLSNEVIEYTHDIYCGETIIGEAGHVDQADDNTMTLGVFSIMGLGASYGILNWSFALVPKSYRNPPS